MLRIVDMDSNPMHPGFGATADYPSTNGAGFGQPTQADGVVESTGVEIKLIAGAIEELQARLERANSQLGQVTSVQTTEIEIGRLFVEAQRFSEATLSKLEMQVQEILLEAEAKATEILREATEEAQEIRRQVQEASSIPARTAQELKTVIAGFANVNGELIRELNALNAMLTPMVDRRSASFDQSSTSLGSK
jgi:hypothetical protein